MLPNKHKFINEMNYGDNEQIVKIYIYKYLSIYH